MGVARFFSGKVIVDFPARTKRNSSKGANSGEISFY